MLSSTPDTGQYCTINTNNATTYQTALVSCNPSSPAYIPVMNFYVNAQYIGIHVPVGMPRIDSATAIPTSEASGRYDVQIHVTNTGLETDTFEAAMKCSRDVSWISARKSIVAGQSDIINVSYQGAGFVVNCPITVKSVNSPQNQANSTVRISITPFCAKQAPNSAVVKVSTDRGCQYVCNNYKDGVDVIDASCSAITTYDRCSYYHDDTTSVTCMKYQAQILDTGLTRYTPIIQNYNFDGCSSMPECPTPLPIPDTLGQEYTCKMSVHQSAGCSSYNEYNGIHCTGIGKYLPINQYMDEVNRFHISPFVPETREHQYFIVSDQGIPKCNYVNEYGYVNGTTINSFTFDPAIAIPSGTQSTVPNPTDWVPPVTSCTNHCTTGQIQNTFPDCACVTPAPTTCTNICEDNQTRNPFPGCECITPIVTQPHCTNVCGTAETQTSYPNCTCTGNVIQQPPGGGSTNNNTIYYVIGGAVILVGGYFILRKKRK
jgi:LPXTG-motif cell wall-anchored protein